MRTDVQRTSIGTFHSEVKPTLGDRQEVVYDAMQHRESFTNSELAAFLNWPINTITPRVKELREIGLVELAGRRRCRVTGMEVNAWRVQYASYAPKIENPSPWISPYEVKKQQLQAQTKLF
jgi:hypothetical protein